LQNIEKAKKEIERLEAEEAAAGNGSGGSTPSKDAKAGTDETVAEAAKKVAEVSIDDKETEAPKEVEATA
jgi:hypothetical protein